MILKAVLCSIILVTSTTKGAPALFLTKTYNSIHTAVHPTVKSSCYLQIVPVSIQPKTCYSLVSEGVDHVPAKLVKENHLVGWKLFHYHASASSIQNKFQPIQAKVLFRRARSHLVRTRCCLKFVSIGAQQVKVAKNENRAENFGNY